MHSRVSLHKKTATHGKIERLLDKLRGEATARFCPRCGSKMINVDALFFLSESHRSWNILLPVCPECAGEKKDLKAVSLKAA